MFIYGQRHNVLNHLRADSMRTKISSCFPYENRGKKLSSSSCICLCDSKSVYCSSFPWDIFRSIIKKSFKLFHRPRERSLFVSQVFELLYGVGIASGRLQLLCHRKHISASFKSSQWEIRSESWEDRCVYYRFDSSLALVGTFTIIYHPIFVQSYTCMTWTMAC